MNTSPAINVSTSACARIAELLAEEANPQMYFRVAVLGGGCSGFQYKFDLEDTALAEDDLLLEKDGARVVVDTTSLELLAGAELDFTQELVGSAFAIKNPNAKSGCGCGNSFAL